jgi:HlyD family secretion protein
VVAELLTTDALKVHVGSRTVIDRWGGPDRLEGRVSRIEPSAFTKISALGVEEQRVEVLIDILSLPQRWQALGDGFRVGVRIITLERDDALLVPVSATFPLPAASGPGQGSTTGANPASLPMAVFAVQDGRARLREVDVGARNGTHAWIRAGLSSADRVIAYPPPAVSDGARVRPRSP